uniref:Tumor necrosis factor alpha-induced protein 2-like n=1 Tax=Seriola lalandi dorsalis TaxID=1841481 RepID=A0A3B4ZEK1_SERLL
GGDERGEERRRLPKLKNPTKFWKNRRKQNHNHTEADSEVDGVEEQREELLEEVSRKLILREEQLFTQDCPSEDEDQLHKDLEDLKLHIWMAVDNTFTSPSSSGQLDVLRSAMASVQQQEVQDRRWMETGPEDRFPAWRPLRCLSTHNALLQNMVESRLTKAAEDESSGIDGLSSPLKREVCHLGRRVRDDLLTVARTVKDCYPANMDILNIYAALYHQRFSARLTELASSGLGVDDCSYLLFWVNHCYPHDILEHEDLDGKIKTACLGSLLLQNHLNRLENQYLTHKEDQVKLWLSTALKKEEESWLNGNMPELIDSYYFSPLAVDVIQVRQSQHSDVICICPGVLQSPVCVQVCYRDLWTSVWLDGSLPVVSCLLDSLSRHLRDLTDLKPACRQVRRCLPVYLSVSHLSLSPPVSLSLQSLLSVVHRDVVLRYVKRMMKTRMKSREQQGGGAQRMKEDAQMINDFFREGVRCAHTHMCTLRQADRQTELLPGQTCGGVAKTSVMK